MLRQTGASDPSEAQWVVIPVIAQIPLAALGGYLAGRRLT
jgi:hypothetical protein